LYILSPFGVCGAKQILIFCDSKQFVDAGAALIHLCEGGMFGGMFGRGQYKDRLAPVLRSAHRDFLMWKKQQKLQCSQPRFTPARLNRTVQTSFLA
jgi:hypothetical protein